MTIDNSPASVRIDIDDIEPLLPPSLPPLTIHHEIVILKEPQNECSIRVTGKQSDFEKDCVHNLNHQYEHWKSNDWGKSPICIPDALEVNKKWFIRTLDPDAADYKKSAVERNASKLEGNKAEQAVHKAFQRSTIGGILIHGLDFASFRKKLLPSKAKIPKETLDNLKKLSDSNSFEMDFLFFHPVCGIIVMECKAINIKSTGGKAHSYAMKQLDRNVKKLLELFKILIGYDCPAELVHYLLCIPNSKKDSLKESEQVNILDKNDLGDNMAFEAFWENRSAHMEHQAGCFTNTNICRFIAIVYGFRSAIFTSFGCNALEIYRMIDAHKSCRHSSRSPAFTTNSIGQHSVHNKKMIFLNNEQISAYERAKSVSSLLLFGPPGCGKTLLIMNLARESAELNKPGRVVVILPYPELRVMYRKYFDANKSNQKRIIVINPSAEELQLSVAGDSVDDVFADEVLYGGWINRRDKRKNGKIILGVTIGRCYNKANVTIARDSLVRRLHDADFSFFELKTVMRNTGNICDYYKRFNPDNQIIIGHNILGKDVKVYNTKNIDSACSFIVEHIKQYLNTSDCTSNDIAVLVAHEPVLKQIETVKRSLQKAGIKAGSVVEQLEMNGTTDESLVAVDCTANVLSCEWPIVFVIDAKECPFSKGVAHPIVACSRAVSSLFVINTQECQYPYLWRFCKKYFATALFGKERQVSAFHLQDLLCEINQDPRHRRLLQFFFWIPWFFSFFVVPTTLFIDLYLIWSHVLFDTSSVTKHYILLGLLSLNFWVIALFCIVSSVLYFLDKYQHLMRIILNVLNVLCVPALILRISIFSNVNNFIINIAVIVFLSLGLNILSTIYYRTVLLQSNWTNLYFKTSSSLISLLRIYSQHLIIYLLFTIAIPLLITVSLYKEHFTLAVYELLILFCSPWLYSSLEVPLRSKHLKCITIDPAA